MSGALGADAAEWNEEFEFNLTPTDPTISLALCDGEAEPPGPGGGGGAKCLASAELPIREIMFSGPCKKWCV